VTITESLSLLQSQTDDDSVSYRLLRQLTRTQLFTTASINHFCELHSSCYDEMPFKELMLLNRENVRCENIGETEIS